MVRIKVNYDKKTLGAHYKTSLMVLGILGGCLLAICLGVFFADVMGAFLNLDSSLYETINIITKLLGAVGLIFFVSVILLNVRIKKIVKKAYTVEYTFEDDHINVKSYSYNVYIEEYNFKYNTFPKIVEKDNLLLLYPTRALVFLVSKFDQSKQDMDKIMCLIANNKTIIDKRKNK